MRGRSRGRRGLLPIAVITLLLGRLLRRRSMAAVLLRRCAAVPGAVRDRLSTATWNQLNCAGLFTGYTKPRVYVKQHFVFHPAPLHGTATHGIQGRYEPHPYWWCAGGGCCDGGGGCWPYPWWCPYGEDGGCGAP